MIRPMHLFARSLACSTKRVNTPSTAAELVEHHPGRARVHGIVPIEPAKRIERAIHVVNTIILNNDWVAILYLIFGHGLISPCSIDGRISPRVASPVISRSKVRASNRHGERPSPPRPGRVVKAGYGSRIARRAPALCYGEA